MDELSPDAVRDTLTTKPTREQLEYERVARLAERLARRGDADAIAEALIAAKRPRKRSTKVVENIDYAVMVERQVRALIKRVGDTGDIECLPSVVALRDVLDEACYEIVEKLLTPHGPLQHKFSWADIGRVMGTTRQAASERFTRTKRVRNRGRVAATVSPIRQETA